MKLFTCLLVFALALISVYSQDKESLKLIVNNPSVRVINAKVSANCCSIYDYIVDIEGFHITITEIDTSTSKCFCTCTFDLETDLNFLNSGHYVVDVIRRELKKFDYPEDRDILAGRDSFNISNLVDPPASMGFIQWECNIAASADDNAVRSLPAAGVYPNPAAGGRVEMEFSRPVAGTIEIIVYNIYGSKVLLAENIKTDAGLNKIPLNVEMLASGSYSCIIRDESGSSRLYKLIVAR